ncbi:MAG: sulfatase-like hydrolase/transferase [Thermoanaerobaculia bacterium]
MKPRALLSIFVLLLAAPGCGKRAGSARYPNAPVVIVSIDTLRSDHLPAYGYRDVETPALDAFRREAILYERAYSHVPLTLPSHATIFTGLLPGGHGIHDNLGYTLASSAGTLASQMKKAGYRTGGAVSAVVLSHLSGVSRGFDFYDDAVEVTEGRKILSYVQRHGGTTAASLESWISGAGTEGPLFAFLHLYEPHAPYEPPEPWKSRFANPYDGEIATADAILGDFFGFLKKNGLYDRSLILVLSDHGEGLGDHGEGEHGIFLYREDLQIPLLVKLPGGDRGGGIVSTPVGLVDVFPGVLSLTGVAFPEGLPLQGRPLPIPGDPEPLARRLFAESYYPRIHFGWSDLASLTDGHVHYIKAPRPEFYDLEKDPGEKTDLAAEKPEGFRAMKIEIEKIPRSFDRPRDVDPEQAKKLASLGYLTGGPAQAAGPLPDPKDGLETLAALGEGFAALKAGRNAEAARTFRRLLDTNPRMQDVWDAESRALFRLGRYDEALAALKKGAELSPSSAAYFFTSIANACLVLGRVDDAKAHAEIALSRGDLSAHEILARVALAKGDVGVAEKEAREAVAAFPRSRLPILALARVEIAQGNFPAALARVDEAEKMTAALSLEPIESLDFLRGEVFARMNRPEEAEKEFKAELRAFPQNPDAQASLALLYAAWGRKADARHVLKEFLAGDPSANLLLTAAQVSTILGDAAEAADYRRRAAAKSAASLTPLRTRGADGGRP